MNRRFYDAHADAFVRKRQYAWRGWARVPVPPPGPRRGRVRLLDVGCGHGRFLADWIAKGRPPVDYVGVDFSPVLLERARWTAKPRPADTVAWREASLPDPAVDFEAPFDLVVAFGVAHHVAGAERRRAFLRQLASFARPGGLVVVTVWRFGREPRFLGRGRPPPAEIAAMDPHATVLDFDGEGERLCVDLPDAETDAWAASSGLVERDRFEADGQSGALNRYLVFVRADTSPPAAPTRRTSGSAK